MYANLITFLAVILLFELYTPSPRGMRVPWWEALAGLGMLVLVFGLWVRLSYRRWVRTLRGGALAGETFPFFQGSFVQRQVILAVAAYAIVLYLLQWKGLCLWLLGRDGSQFLTSLLGIVPFLALLLAAWTASYPSRAEAWRPRGSILSYVSSQAKLHLPILLPWLGILLAMDLLGVLSPHLRRRIEEDLLWGLVVFVLLLVVLAWAFPGLMVRLWRCHPLPGGPLRERLEAFFARHGFRYREIVLWTIFEGASSTAGILGVFPASRYILITPSLLESLDEDELEAVMAHEMGHARHRHMPFYLAFMVGLTLVFDLSLEGVSWLLTLGSLALEARGTDAAALLGHPETAATIISLLVTIPAVLLAVLYLRFGFGLFSRNFERQSDLHAMAIKGTAEPIVRSLDKITGFSPMVRLLPNWHHFGVQERIDFLMACKRHPPLVGKHHRKVRLLVGGYLIFLLALGGFLVGWKTQGWGKKWTLGMLQRVAQQRLQAQPENPILWLAFGSIALERRQALIAEDALRRAVALDPNNPEALNNLAWLYATAEEPAFRRPQEALDLARRAEALRPGSAHILDTLAEAFFVNGRVAEALETEMKALRLAADPSDHYRAQVKRFREALPKAP